MVSRKKERVVLFARLVSGEMLQQLLI